MRIESNMKTTVVGRYLGGDLFVPHKVRGNYGMVLLIDDESEYKIANIIQAVKNEVVDASRPRKLEIWGVRVGDDPEYSHTFERKFIHAKSKDKPKIMKREAGCLVDVTEEERLVYAGCYVAASVHAYAYPEGDDHKPGISLCLRGILFITHGEPIGDVMSPDEEFREFSSDFGDGQSLEEASDIHSKAA